LSSQLNFSSIAALMPISESGPEGGKRTRICYSNGEAEEIGRRVKTVLKNTADHFSINLVRQRQRYGEYFQRRQGVPLPLSSGMVLVPLKMLKSSLYNDEVTGYVNASDVLEISEASPDEAALGIRCIIDLKGGHRIPCHFSVESVKRKSRTAQLALEHFRSLISAPLQKPDFSWQKEGPYFVKNIDSTLRPSLQQPRFAEGCCGRRDTLQRRRRRLRTFQRRRRSLRIPQQEKTSRLTHLDMAPLTEIKKEAGHKAGFSLLLCP